MILTLLFFSDIQDEFAVNGMDIDVSGRNYNVLGSAITDCRVSLPSCNMSV